MQAMDYTKYIINAISEVIIIRDLDNKILLWNKNAEKLYGLQEDEVIGKNINTSSLIKKSMPDEVILSRVLEEGEWQGELHQVTKSGQEIEVKSRWLLLRDEANNPHSILTIITDITKYKQEEASLYIQNSEQLVTLASGMFHDLNNILTPILSISQLLPCKLPQLDEDNRKLLKIMLDNSKRSGDLVKQVLSFITGAQSEHNLLELKHLLVELVQVIEATFPQSIKVFKDFLSKDLWLVSGNATQLYQVFMNLCINACDAMKRGGNLTISAENISIDENNTLIHQDAKIGDYVVVTVKDTGIGIVPNLLEHIFDPFVTTKKPGIGTGLGLSTVMSIVKAHGGFITVESKINVGSSFQIYLPANKAKNTAPIVENLDSFMGHGELILIVDDEVAIRESVKAALQTYNYKVITASDGIEAIALYAEYKHEISTVLLNLIMPSIDPRTTIMILQKINSQIPIVAMSGLVFNEANTNVCSMGAQAFLAKPFTNEEMLQTLHTVVGNSSCITVEKQLSQLDSETLN